MSALMDIWNTIIGIVSSADMITLAIMAVIVLAAGFMMQGLGHIINTAILALIVLVIATFVRDVAFNGANAAQLAEANWHAFMGMAMLTLLAYVVGFAIVIGIVHLIRSLVMR
ncbi:MAG TPA: hypothetical protein VFI93_10665 [Rhizomicrobium sp.]|nr:hypothetical protein [Rhizomicrobium sp.]